MTNSVVHKVLPSPLTFLTLTLERNPGYTNCKNRNEPRNLHRPRAHLRGKAALIREVEGGRVLAQFDDRALTCDGGPRLMHPSEMTVLDADGA